MLTDLNRVKIFLQKPQSETEDDFLIEDIIRGVTEAIENYCNRKFQKAEYKERIEAIETIWVKNTPIADVTEIKDKNGNNINFDFDEDRIYIEKEKYKTITGANRYVESEEQKYFVKYIGGYTNIPFDLLMVATEIVATRYKEYRDETYNLKSKSEGSVNQNFIDPSVIQEKHLLILDNYKVVLL